MDIDDMKASWLEAVAAGQAGEFARHFVPDILEALAASQERVRVMTEALERVREQIDGHERHHQIPHRYCLACDISEALASSPTPSAPKDEGLCNHERPFCHDTPECSREAPKDESKEESHE